MEELLGARISAGCAMDELLGARIGAKEELLGARIGAKDELLGAAGAARAADGFPVDVVVTATPPKYC